MKRSLLSLLTVCFISAISFAQVTTIGLIGEGTPLANWDEDIDMVQDAQDTAVWTLSVTLSDGPVKFRANDEWVMDWGNPNPADFMSGIGEQGGGNMSAFAGDYEITFNHVTGEYTFAVQTDIGMIGPATPAANWDDDINMYKDQNDPNKFFSWVNLTADDMKFRKDDDWAVNWGANTFPVGTAVLGDPGNIPVAPAGFYFLTFDTLTGEYNFGGETVYDSISLIGEGIAGDWDTDYYLVNDPQNVHIWTTNITLAGGGIKFRANSDWGTNWGGVDFPNGDGVLGGNDNIPSTAGTYDVIFNSKEATYRFIPEGTITTIGMIGTATPNAWNDPDTDMVQDASNPHIWTLRLDLTDGEAKFRANDDWAAGSWGAADWPVGYGELDGTVNIPVTAGDYIVTFNSLTGYYVFSEVVEYDFIGMIGKSGPAADWETDFAMDKDPSDFNKWTIPSITLTEYDPMDSETGVKFRANMDWGVNWGPADQAGAFPGGVGTANGLNIPCTAGDWRVEFNSSNGEYLFSEVSSNEELLDLSAINIYPNPTKELLNISIEATELKGEVSYKVVDMTGKVLLDQKSRNLTQLDVSALATGNYMLQISNDDFLIAKRFNVTR